MFEPGKAVTVRVKYFPPDGGALRSVWLELPVTPQAGQSRGVVLDFDENDNLTLGSIEKAEWLD
jgi:hypothetical protein